MVFEGDQIDRLALSRQVTMSRFQIDPLRNTETYQYLGADLPDLMTSVRIQAHSKEASSWLLTLSSFVLNMESLRVSFFLLLFFFKSYSVSSKKEKSLLLQFTKKKFLKMTFSLMTSFAFFGKRVRKTPHLHKQNQLCLPLLSLHVLDYFLFKQETTKIYTSYISVLLNFQTLSSHI